MAAELDRVGIDPPSLHRCGTSAQFTMDITETGTGREHGDGPSRGCHARDGNPQSRKWIVITDNTLDDTEVRGDDRTTRHIGIRGSLQVRRHRGPTGRRVRRCDGVHHEVGRADSGVGHEHHDVPPASIESHKCNHTHVGLAYPRVMALAPDHEARIERWLVRRGIPHFIDQYSASRDVLTRAIPLLTFIFLIEILGAGKLGWPWWANRLAELAGLGVLLGIWALVNRSRGRSPLARPDHVGWIEVGVFVLGPAILPAVFGGEIGNAAATVLANLSILGVVYLATSYGVVPMARWAAWRLVVQVGETLRLFTRGLPLLLVAFTFLFINAEVWQVAASLDGAFLAAALLLFGLVGAIFVISRLPDEIRPLASFIDRDEIASLVADSPAAGLEPPSPDAVEPPTRGGWVNAGLVMLFVQGLRIVVASLMIGAFFVLFGLITMRPETIEVWTGAPVDILATFMIGDRQIAVTGELLAVSSFLAGFSGMYFSVSVVTDATLRAEFFDDVRAEIRETFAVRAVYMAARVTGNPKDPAIG